MRYIWIFLLSLSPVWAHQSLLTDSGDHVRWTKSYVPLVLKLENSNQGSQSEIKYIIQNSIEEWNKYSEVKVVSASSDPTGNSLSFVKNFPYGRGILGVTEVKHSAAGVIDSAKIFINDDYSFSTITSPYRTFLGDVVTHELGHMLGLGHSEVLDSTMFYTSFAGHYSLASDDIAGVRGKYDKQNFGRISGFIQGGNGVGILGTHVQAISRTTGASVGAISKANGEFEIAGLDLDDTYYLYTSPLKKLDSLPGYFANTQSNFCPGSYQGSFFSECGREGIPQGINLSNTNASVNVGVVTINCGYKTPLLYSQSKTGEGHPIDFHQFAPGNYEKAMSGWFTHAENDVESKPDVFQIDLSELKAGIPDENLFVRILALAHPFGSEIDLKIKVLPNNVGSMIPGTNSSVIELPLSLASGPLEVEVTSVRNSHGYTSFFPVFEEIRGKVSYPYLMIAGIVKKNGSKYSPLINTESYLSDNSSCLEAPFAKSIDPIKVHIEKLSANEDIVAPSCGTTGTPPTSGPGSSGPLMVLGFLLTMLASFGVKSSKKFLS